MKAYIVMIKAGSKDYTQKVEAPIEHGGDLNCPIREIAVAASKGTGKADVIAAGICTNDCICWHTGCPLMGGRKPPEVIPFK